MFSVSVFSFDPNSSAAEKTLNTFVPAMLFYFINGWTLMEVDYCLH